MLEIYERNSYLCFVVVVVVFAYEVFKACEIFVILTREFSGKGITITGISIALHDF